MKIDEMIELLKTNTNYSIHNPVLMLAAWEEIKAARAVIEAPAISPNLVELVANHFYAKKRVNELMVERCAIRKCDASTELAHSEDKLTKEENVNGSTGKQNTIINEFEAPKDKDKCSLNVLDNQSSNIVDNQLTHSNDTLKKDENVNESLTRSYCNEKLEVSADKNCKELQTHE